MKFSIHKSTLLFSLILAGWLSPAVSASHFHTRPPQNSAETEFRVATLDILGEDWMSGKHHQVYPYAVLEGDMLRYQIRTEDGDITVKGTQDVRVYIYELYATEILRMRSTPGVVLQSTGARMVNLVKTPVRVAKGLGSRAGEVESLGDAALFIPELTVDVAGGLLNGVGELFVTGERLTSGVGATRCKGFNCVKKAGSDIWSGANSLMGKHNAARKLHREFGTDPQTENKDYRFQIDRIAYAESYIGTAVKIGVGNAGIEAISPVMQGVGYYNNGEFISNYEDAHRRRNFEKDQIEAWGEDRMRIEAFYKSKIFTKQQRREFFKLLNPIGDTDVKRRLFDEAYWAQDRAAARAHLSRARHISAMHARGEITTFDRDTYFPSYKTRSGRRVTPVYGDLLHNLEALNWLHNDGSPQEMHVIGRASKRFINAAQRQGVTVRQFPQ